MRFKACFEARGQVIRVTDDELVAMRLDLRTMVVDVDDAPAGANISRVRMDLISRYGAYVSEPELPECDSPEQF